MITFYLNVHVVIVVIVTSLHAKPVYTDLGSVYKINCITATNKTFSRW